MAKHTQGEWFVSDSDPFSVLDYNGGRGPFRLILSANSAALVTGTGDHTIPPAEAEANARIAAAAPDLLAALQALFACELEKCMRFDGHDDQLEAVERARAAIARATPSHP